MSRLATGISSWQIVLAFLVLCSRIQAASVEGLLQNAQGNTTILGETKISGWADSANFRGTSDILWSCIVTIFASAWTAMHPNIPVQTKSEIKRLGHRLELTITALLCPELVLQNAFEQYQSARGLRRELHKLNNDSDDTKIYNITYGFYVEMGGFVADVRDFSDAHPRIKITRKGIEVLAKQGYRFKVLPEEIKDRSKSDSLAKFIVCCQISWIFLQCIVRSVAGYTLTLLEIHTMISVICTLLIYILWWHKPMAIQEAIVVKTEGMEDLIAAMLVAEMYRWRRKEFPTLDDFATELILADDAQSTLHDLTGNTDSSNIKKLSEPSESDVVLPTNKEKYANSIQCLSSNKVTLTDGSYIICGKDSIDALNITSKDIKRWDLVAKALRRPDSSSEGSHIVLAEVKREFSGCVEIILSVDDKKNGFGSFEHQVEIGYNEAYDEAYEGVMRTWYEKTPAALLSMVYGGLHLIAWNYEFPSKIECLWWRISGLGIVILPVLYVLASPLPRIIGRLIGIGVNRYPKPFKIVKRFFEEGLEKYLSFRVPTGLVILMPAIFWATCRVYILVESFISLRYLALGCFANTPWLQAIPHY